MTRRELVAELAAWIGRPISMGEFCLEYNLGADFDLSASGTLELRHHVCVAFMNHKSSNSETLVNDAELNELVSWLFAPHRHGAGLCDISRLRREWRVGRL